MTAVAWAAAAVPDLAPASAGLRRSKTLLGAHFKAECCVCLKLDLEKRIRTLEPGIPKMRLVGVIK